MKYFKEEAVHQGDAYWISPWGEILPLASDEHHIQIVVQNPEKFGLTYEEIKSIYERHGELELLEKDGAKFEGKAREEIMKKLIFDNWIRIRHYPRADKYTINVNEPSLGRGIPKRAKNYIYKWAKGMVEKGRKFSDVYIDTRSGGSSYSMSEIAQDALFNENEKSPDTKEDTVVWIESAKEFGKNKKLSHYMEELYTESSLSRLWRWNFDYDCGAITAFRQEDTDGNPLSRKENEARNRELSAALMSKGYNITRIKGKYPEEKADGTSEPVKEDAFFVVDIERSGNLEDDLLELGKLYEQDSVLIIPIGAIQNTTTAYLLGTNPKGTEFIKYKQKIPFEKGKMGIDSPIYTSYIKGRPFIFEHAASGFMEKPKTGFATGEYIRSKQRYEKRRKNVIS